MTAEAGPLPPISDAEVRIRELEIAHEITQAFLRATRPIEVYRLALAQITPLVGASFSSVFLRDPDVPDLLKLECAQNWPQASARFLGQLRFRVGRGPTGRSVERGEIVEVPDLFADPSLLEWREPARELGFVSMITLPLRRGDEWVGAISFYFDTARQFSAQDRRLLSVVTDQLSRSVARAEQLEVLRAENEKLTRANQRLEAQVGEANQSQRMGTQFLSNVSHELRTPLTAILGHSFLLTNELNGNLSELQRNAIQKIDRAANALLRLINDLLQLTEMNLGRAKPVIAPENAVALAERAFQNVGEPPQNVSFEVVTEGPSIAIATDGDKVVCILENLLSNAYKFTPAGDVKIRVQRTSVGGHPRVSWAVEDSGIGINEDEHVAIFDEFRQVDGSSTRLYGGTGLGLALSLRLAKLLGGDISVRSHEGKGSTFTLSLPD